MSGSRYSCEDSDFACIDPDAACVDDDDVTAETASCIATFLGDAYCDEVNNNAACGTRFPLSPARRRHPGLVAVGVTHLRYNVGGVAL